MHLALQVQLIERYTSPGDIILDPMAGIGTILVACSLGRNVICVELEAKFCDMMRGNWEKVKQRGPQMGFEMGHAEIICGDARHLEGLLADAIITSPPYEASLEATSRHTKGGIPERDKKLGQTGTYGDIDAIITSPPYASTDPMADKEWFLKHREEFGGGGVTGDYVPKADCIITSPPYEGCGDDMRVVGLNSQKCRRDSERAVDYAPSQDNLGNLKGPDYLSQMLLVYEQCHKALRPGGLMVLVTKNFIRDKQIVRLDSDTIALCEKAGFALVEKLQRKLTQQSFWRTIYQQKYPDAPRIEYEDILVFKQEVD